PRDVPRRISPLVPPRAVGLQNAQWPNALGRNLPPLSTRHRHRARLAKILGHARRRDRRRTLRVRAKTFGASGTRIPHLARRVHEILRAVLEAPASARLRPAGAPVRILSRPPRAVPRGRRTAADPRARLE